jgi:hypothetical protein
MRIITYAVMNMETLNWVHEESYNYIGPLDLNCGPSQQEKNLEQQEASFDQTLQQDYSQTFAQNQEILGNLNSVLQPIVNAGPSQQGYSPAELSALNTQATDLSAQAVNQETQAAAAQENAAGGGTSFLPSGVNAQLNASINSAAENNLSQEKLGITQANYAQGEQNWQTALAGEENVAGQQNPLGYAGQTTSANSTAFGEANTIQQEENQEESDIIGGVAQGALGIATGGASLGLGGLFGAAGSALGGSPDQVSSYGTSNWYGYGNEQPS